MIPVSAPPLSRRQFLVTSGLASATVLWGPSGLLASPESPVPVIRRAAASAQVGIHRIRDNLGLLEGAGGNIVALTGPEGVLLVDAGITGARPQILGALRQLGAEPVRFVINTHWHYDHTDGNEWLSQAGARIIAHTNTAARLGATVRVEGWNFTFEPSPAAAIPTVQVEDRLRLRINERNLTLQAYPPSHTDTDLSIHLAEDDVLCVGDIWWNGHYPFIDYSSGGSIDGTLRAVDTTIARIGRTTLVVPGHGPVGGVTELTAYRDMLAEVRERVATLKRQGRSLAEAVAARPTERYDATWGGFVIDAPTFTALVYQGV